MLRINAIPNSAAAKAYYEQADYYIDGHELEAHWHGKGAEMLGLTGPVQKADFESLCENRDPRTGLQLTAKHIDHRRVGYDFTFSVSKSVSLAYALGGDERIATEFRAAVADTMAELEREMATRVRKLGADQDRQTGNVIWTDFLHHTSRPINGTPDPQLHIHAVVFNATFDQKEDQWKAGQFGGIKADGAYWQAVFRSRLADRLQRLGYGINRTKDDFEIVGVPERTVKEFSRRAGLIERTAKHLGITRPETKAKLGATTREPKKEGQTWASLLAGWANRTKGSELTDIESTVANVKPREVEHANAEALDWAIRHSFERKSVVSERELVAAALKHGVGSATPEGIYRELADRKDLIRREVNGKSMISTQGVLGEEKAIVAFAQKNRGHLPVLAALSTGRPLANQKAKAGGTVGNPLPDLSELSLSQREAVKHVWGSRDSLIVVRGGAGTGKTTMTKAMLAGINMPTVVLAPSAEASRGVLRREGFEGAETLAKFLGDGEMQAKVRNGLIVLDEASLAGAHDMYRLVKSADELNARVVLLGDRRQHKSVARGDVLALLEDRAGLPVAEVSEIQRQKGEYKQVAELLQKGRMGAALAKLDGMGWVKNTNHFPDSRKLVVDDYWNALHDGKSALIVVPTHAEGDKLSEAIRAKGHELGVLQGDDKELPTLRNLNYSQAELDDAKKRQRLDPLKASPEELGDKRVILTRYGAFVRETKKLSVGDVIRATAGGKDTDGKRFDSGTMFRVKGIEGDKISVVNESSGAKRMLEGFQNWTHGYVATSQAGQGRTVDRAFLWVPEATFPAVRMDTAYTSGTRGRESVTIYTDNREGLLDAMVRVDDRMLATDLVRVPRKGIREKLKRRVSFLRDLGNRATSKVHELIHRREMVHGR